MPMCLTTNPSTMSGLHGLSAVASEMLRMQGQGEAPSDGSAPSTAPSSIHGATAGEGMRRSSPSASLPFRKRPCDAIASEATVDGALLRLEQARRASLAAPGLGAAAIPPLSTAALPSLPPQAAYEYQRQLLLREGNPHLMHPGRYHEEVSGRYQPPLPAHPSMNPSTYSQAGLASMPFSSATSTASSASSDEILARARASEAQARASWLDAARQRMIAQETVSAHQQHRARIENEILHIQDRMYRDRLAQDELMARRMASYGHMVPQASIVSDISSSAVGSSGALLNGLAEEDARAVLEYSRASAARGATANAPLEPQKGLAEPASQFQAMTASQASEAIANFKPDEENDKRLFLPSDPTFLTEAQCFLRASCIETFVSTPDGHFAASGKCATKPSGRDGQAGFRCIHCKDTPKYLRANQAVCFPSKRENIMESVRNFTRIHLDACPFTPEAIKSKYSALALRGHGPRRSPRLVKAYYSQAASEAGLVDTPRGLEYRPENRKRYPSEAMRAILKAAEAEDEALANGSTLASLYAHEEPQAPKAAASKSLDEDVRYGKLESLATDETKRVLREAQKEATTFVQPSDFADVSDHVYLLFHQLVPCKPTEATVKRRRLNPDQLHVPGLRCRHCVDEEGINGAYFPLNAGSLGDSSFSQTLLVHLSGCSHCPQDIKNALSELTALVKEHRSCARRGSKKKFVRKVWSRLEEIARKKKGMTLESIEEGNEDEQD